MSSSKSVDDGMINGFIRDICSKYELEFAHVRSMWDERCKQHDDDLAPERLLRCLKTELVALCKKRGVKCTGNKAQLIKNLLGKTGAELSASKSKKTKKTSAAPVAKRLALAAPVLELRKNKFGNYEHFETGFVFNKVSKKVIGKQSPDGSVIPLTTLHIDECKRLNLDYALPENINSGVPTDDEPDELFVSDDEEEELIEEILSDDDEA